MYLRDIHGVRPYLEEATKVVIHRSLYQMTASIIQDSMTYTVYNGDTETYRTQIIKCMNDGSYDYHRKAFSDNIARIINQGIVLEFHQDDDVWNKKYSFTRNQQEFI